MKARDSATRVRSPGPGCHAVAADWLQRLEDPHIPEADLQAWLEWYDASEENRKSFDETQSLYRRLKGMPDEHRAALRARVQPAVESQPQWLLSLRRWALAASVAGAAAGVLWWRIEAGPQDMVYAAPSDHHRAIELADGSELALGADAMVKVTFDDTQRAVNLERGQVYFEIAPEMERPFVVRAGRVRITAIGTAFNVLRADDEVAITVTEGVVEVLQGLDGLPPLRIVAGRRVSVSLDHVAPEPRLPDKVPESPWRVGRAEFVDAPLDDVLRVVNQHAPRPLVIDDPRVADFTYSGSILQEHIDEWVASLPQIYPIQPVVLEDGSITLVMRR